MERASVVTPEHDIPERQARLFVDKYNRALLRKTMRDLEEGRKQGARELAPTTRRVAAPAAAPIKIAPSVGIGTLGSQGSF